jgi:hypothetical protein
MRVRLRGDSVIGKLNYRANTMRGKSGIGDAADYRRRPATQTPIAALSRSRGSASKRRYRCCKRGLISIRLIAGAGA